MAPAANDLHDHAAMMDPPRCLGPGMHVRIEIDGIGTIDNPVIAQPAV